MADEPNWKRRFLDESRGRPTSGDFRGGSNRSPERFEKRLLETEESTTPQRRHAIEPQAGGIATGSAMQAKKVGETPSGVDLVIDERVSVHAVDDSTRDARRGPRTYDEHQNQRDLCGHSRTTERGDSAVEAERRLESSKRTKLSED